MQSGCLTQILLDCLGSRLSDRVSMCWIKKVQHWRLRRPCRCSVNLDQILHIVVRHCRVFQIPMLFCMLSCHRLLIANLHLRVPVFRHSLAWTHFADGRALHMHRLRTSATRHAHTFMICCSCQERPYAQPCWLESVTSVRTIVFRSVNSSYAVSVKTIDT